MGAGTMLILDSLYLRTVSGVWNKMVSNIQGSHLNVRVTSAIAVYVLMSFALFYFIIAPKRSVHDAALLGLVIYGVFDLTNYAIFNKYSLIPALLDMAWGSFLFAASTFAVKLLTK